MKPIVLKIKTLAASERKITAEIIDCIREIDLLKIHLELGYPSLMEFLVRECGYSETAALRPIDAARVVSVIPEIRADLKSGSLNLSQVSILAQSVMQKEKAGEKVSLETKKELIKTVKHKRSYEVQKIAAQMLELPVLQTEKAQVQADESVRVEMRFSKAEMETLNRAKEILGHIKPGMSTKELIVLMAERVLKTKDPAREVRVRRSKGNFSAREMHVRRNKVDRDGGPTLVSVNQESINQGYASQASKTLRSATEFISKNPSFSKRESDLESFKSADQISESVSPKIPKGVSASTRRQVFRRDKVCQWVSPTSGRKCESRHLIEIDHKCSKWAGGNDDLENLELKCRAQSMEIQAGGEIGFLNVGKIETGILFARGLLVFVSQFF